MAEQLLSSYGKAFRDSAVAIAVIDSVSLDIVFSNKAFLRFFKDVQAINGKNLFGLVPNTLQALRDCVLADALVACDWPAGNARFEFSAIDPPGAESSRVQCVVLPLSAAAMAGTAPAMAEAVNESYRRVLDHLPHNTWLCTAKAELFWTNRTSNLFTYGEAEFYDPGNTRHLAKVHPDDLTGACVAMSQAMAAGHMPQPCRYRLRDHNGDYHWFQFSVAPVLDASGAAGYWVGTSVNIQAFHDAEQQALARIAELENRCASSESRLLESQRVAAQQHKMELVAHLAGGVAHDLNNLLHVMGINVEMMQPHAQHGAMHQHMQILEGCLKKAGRLSTQLAGFSGRMPQNAVALDPAQLVIGVQELLSKAVGAEVDFCIDLGTDLHPVLADKSYLENALINLAINARDAVERRGVVRLTVENRVACCPGGIAGDYVLFSVEDNGAGIPAELQSRIFEPFFSTKPAGKGTGLGLPMVRIFVESSGGFVEAHSVPGQGTRMSLYLPRCEAVQELAPDASAPLQPGVGKVLLVEDDESVREAMDSILTQLGYSTMTSFNVDHAVMLMDNGVRPDLIISDIRMPGKLTINDLIDVVEARVHVPIIFATGYSADVAVTEGLIQDRYPVLFKPFSACEISARIGAVLARGAADDGSLAA
jgi:signal transduction histidine kinase